MSLPERPYPPLAMPAPALRDLVELRRALRTIEREFAKLYALDADTPFAMEIEFKVTGAGVLAIKQARPWVF